MTKNRNKIRYKEMGDNDLDSTIGAASNIRKPFHSGAALSQNTSITLVMHGNSTWIWL